MAMAELKRESSPSLQASSKAARKEVPRKNRSLKFGVKEMIKQTVLKKRKRGRRGSVTTRQS